MNPQFIPGEVVAAAKLNQLPKGILGYAEVTANQGPITTITDLTSLSVAVTLAAGRRIRVTGHGVALTAASSTASGHIREGSTILGRYGRSQTGASVGELNVWSGTAILTPTAGAHTYKLSFEATSGNVTLQAAAGSPAFILVEDIGAST